MAGVSDAANPRPPELIPNEAIWQASSSSVLRTPIECLDSALSTHPCRIVGSNGREAARLAAAICHIIVFQLLSRVESEGLVHCSVPVCRRCSVWASCTRATVNEA